jgi:hypothetical protein
MQAWDTLRVVMDAREADAVRRALADIDQVRTATRSRLGAFWFPQVVIGAAMLVAGLGGLAAGFDALRWLMFAASLVAMPLVIAFYRRRGRRIGLRTRSWPYAVLAAAGIVACVVAASLPAQPPDVGTWLAAAPVYLGISLLQRSPAIAVWSVVVAAIALAASVLAPGAPAGAVTCVESAVALTAGVVLRVHPPAA